MQMTYDQYIQNPMGVANSVISNREMYKKMYTEKLDKILVRELANKNRMYHRLFKDGDRYLAYLKIPSETVPDFYYDVVVEFTPPKGAKTAIDSTLKNYLVRFYANDPSFVYTFAHAFYKNDMFIKEFSEKMSKRAIKERADQKNPKDIIGYVKSLYFAYIIMMRLGLFVKAKYSETYVKTTMLSYITEADVMLDRREKAEVVMRKENKAAKANEDRMRGDRTADKKEVDPRRAHAIMNTNRAANVKVTPVIKPVKNSKVINAVNKVKKTKRS